MTQVLVALATLTAVLRSTFLVLGVGFAVIAAVDWSARTRRLNPFGGIARFLRGSVDPRLSGIERQVVRAGGQPSTTPWWALIAFIVLSLVFLAALDMLAGIVREIAYAADSGGTGYLYLMIRWAFAILRLALLVRVLSSWFPRAANSRWLRWSFGATEWMLRPLRRVIPSFGMVDITPIVAYFILQIAEGLVSRVLFAG
jgi:YggT family protein